MNSEKKRRGELQRRLAEHLGGKLAEDLMGEFPPDGWESLARQDDLIEVKFAVIALQSELEDVKSDVAVLKSDVAGLKSDVAVLKSDVAGLKTDVAGLKSDVGELRRDFSRMHGTLRFMIGSFITVSAAVIAILVQVSLSVASLR